MLKTIDFGFAECSAHEQSNLLSPQFTAPMAFQTAGARHAASFQGKACRTFLEPFLEPLWNLVEPCGTLVESLQNFLEPGETSRLPRTIPQPSQKRGTLKPSCSPCRTWWNPAGTVVEPCHKPPRTTPTPQPAQKFVEPWWTLVEPYFKPPRATPQPCRTWWNHGGTLVEPSWNLPQTGRRNCVEPNLKPPRTTPRSPCRTWSNHGGTMVEPWWNHGGTMVEPWWNPRQALSNHPDHRSPRRNWWNPGGTLVEPHLRAAKDHPGAYLG